MSQPKPVTPSDPAGLDKLLLAAGKGCARFLEGVISRKLGSPVNFWDGADGLGAILEEQLQNAGVPNKRFGELLRPRLVLDKTGVLPKKKRIVRRIKR
jgi:hypothetical protein